MSDPSWSGTLRIGATSARIDGTIGGNAHHRHLALQLSTGLDGPVQVELADGIVFQAATILVGSMVPHRLGPVGQRVRSWYIEPRCALGHSLVAHLGASPAVALDSAFMDQEDWDVHAPAGSRAIDGSADSSGAGIRLLALIEKLGTGEPIGRPSAWAKALNLSTGRLRAVCLATYGVSPSRLAQWLQLRRASAAVASGCGLAEAAVAAGFSDQAHFTRRLREWFGVSPRRGLSGMTISVVEAFGSRAIPEEDMRFVQE